jgi:aminomethyltransferase
MPKKTPLFEHEKRLGARFTEFAGWELPLYYSSIIDEHMAVRSSVGVFDISHLGKIVIHGEGATQLMQQVATADVEKIPVERGAYTLFCNEDGGILDDEIIYRPGEESYLTIPNAARTQIMFDWFNQHKPASVEIIDQTADLCLLALQGPESGAVLESALRQNPAEYKRFAIKRAGFEGFDFTVMKSGYTGEDGFEIIADPAAAGYAWEAFIKAGAKSCGLGARDTLRLEMGFSLYGKDLTTATTPVEAGLERFVSLSKGDFIGRKAILNQIEKGINTKLVGFIVADGIARDSSPIFIHRPDSGEKKEIGIVTSGGYSPVLRKGIGMAYVITEYAQVGTSILVQVRHKFLEAKIVERPFIIR